MVGVAVGSMNIRGSLDTSLIERGFDRVSSGFEGVKGQAKGFTSDLVRMSQSAAGLAKKLSALALVGVGTMIALAKSAPAVAPALAKMKLSMFKLSMALGEALAPAFERVAGWLEKFTNWVEANPEKISKVAEKVLDFAEKIGEWLFPALVKVGDWALEHPKLFAGIFLGLVFGPKIIAGIASVVGLVTILGGTVVGASVLTALGYIVAIGGLSFGGFKIGEWIGEKLAYWKPPGSKETLGEGAYGMLIRTPIIGGIIQYLNEENRREILLALWDSSWS